MPATDRPTSRPIERTTTVPPTLTVQNGYDDHTDPEGSWALPPLTGDPEVPFRFGRSPGDPRDINIEIGAAFSRHMGSFVFDAGQWWLVVPIHDPAFENKPKTPITVKYLNRTTVATVSEGGWLALGPGDQGRIDFISTEPNQVGWLEFTVTDPGQEVGPVTAPAAVEVERLHRRDLVRGVAVVAESLVDQQGGTVRPVPMAPADRQALIVASWFAWDDPFGHFLTPRQTAWVLKDLMTDEEPGKRWVDATDDAAKERYLKRRTDRTSESLNRSVGKWAKRMDRRMEEDEIEARMTTWPNLPSWGTSKRYTIQWLRAWGVLTDADRLWVRDKLGGEPYGGVYPGAASPGASSPDGTR